MYNLGKTRKTEMYAYLDLCERMTRLPARCDCCGGEKCTTLSAAHFSALRWVRNERRTRRGWRREHALHVSDQVITMWDARHGGVVDCGDMNVYQCLNSACPSLHPEVPESWQTGMICSACKAPMTSIQWPNN